MFKDRKGHKFNR